MNFGQDFLDANMMHIFCWIVIDDVCLFFRCVMFLQLHEIWSHYASIISSASPNSEAT